MALRYHQIIQKFTMFKGAPCQRTCALPVEFSGASAASQKKRKHIVQRGTCFEHNEHSECISDLKKKKTLPNMLSCSRIRGVPSLAQCLPLILATLVAVSDCFLPQTLHHVWHRSTIIYRPIYWGGLWPSFADSVWVQYQKFPQSSTGGENAPVFLSPHANVREE